MYYRKHQNRYKVLKVFKGTSKLIIQYKDGICESFHPSHITPTGYEMRNPGSEELRKVLKGDGRDLLVLIGDQEPRVICIEIIQDIILDGKSVLIGQIKHNHRCSVWCDKC